MALHLGDASFAAACRELFDNGKAWMDENLFNGEYSVIFGQIAVDSITVTGLGMAELPGQITAGKTARALLA